MNRELRSIFSQYHPTVQLLYIVAALFCAMFTLQPLFVILSFVAGSIYSIFLNGVRKYLKGLRILVFLFVIIVIVNPLTNHNGRTVLFYVMNKPFTLEALLYGIFAAGMLVSIFVWFQCYQALITNDKFMYLFGRIAPTTSMIISMIMHFIPVTIKKYHEISYAQKGMEGVATVKKKGCIDKIRNETRKAGILMSRCLEDSIDTAMSMRSRGYGSGDRTHFSTYKIKSRDVLSLVIIGTLFIVTTIGLINENATFSFFPSISVYELNGRELIRIILYMILLFYPLFIEAKDVWFRESIATAE